MDDIVGGIWVNLLFLKKHYNSDFAPEQAEFDFFATQKYTDLLCRKWGYLQKVQKPYLF